MIDNRLVEGGFRVDAEVRAIAKGLLKKNGGNVSPALFELKRQLRTKDSGTLVGSAGTQEEAFKYFTTLSTPSASYVPIVIAMPQPHIQLPHRPSTILIR